MNDPMAEALEAEVLAQDLMRFAARLRAMSDLATPQPSNGVGIVRGRSTATFLPLARKMYRARRLRDKFLPAELFGEPVWDMLLDLYIAQIESREVNVTSACIASCIPQSTALRYIIAMEEHGIVERYGAAHDKRVHFVRLTMNGARRMQRYLRLAGMSEVDGGGTFMLAVK